VTVRAARPRAAAAFFCVLAGLAGGCAVAPAPGDLASLPDCFESNYDRELRLFTPNGALGGAAHQHCVLTVVPAGSAAPLRQLGAGRYFVSLANGGGGGAGGTLQILNRPGGGGGGGGAGARETQTTVNLAEGRYVLTIGAGGPGGSECMRNPFPFGGGPGWAGSPSNMVRADSGALVAGLPGAETYARPSRSANERLAGENDGHGGSGPGQAAGGRGAFERDVGRGWVDAVPGQDKRGPGGSRDGGDGGAVPATGNRTGAGGGGGATSFADGGDGGGESARSKDVAPEHGRLGSGGGGGEGNTNDCGPGAPGGNGYIAIRPA
jgi:hypothetical protein